LSRIRSLHADFILDSRGVPAVEVAVGLDNGIAASASSPSGLSTGSHESIELRDGDQTAWGGQGVGRALRLIREVIAPALMNREVHDQREIDSLLIELDGTPDRSRLGANSLVAVSVACARAAAASEGVPLWRHLAVGKPQIPLPMVNILSGNLHARGGMDAQDILVIPTRAPDYPTALAWACDVYRATQQVLLRRGVPTLVGDEGGFGWTAGSTEEGLDLMMESIELAGLTPSKDVSIGIDMAASHLVVGGEYRLDGMVQSAADLSRTYAKWIDRYPICSLEDPFGQDAWSDWANFCSATPTVQILADDLIATHLTRFETALATGAASAVLVKANQIGTLSEALDVVEFARRNGWRAVVSARSGETEDDWLADLAVASGAGQIKIGSVARSERLSKYNRLLRIARLEDAPPYSGGGVGLPAVS
jgi:enolase